MLMRHGIYRVQTGAMKRSLPARLRMAVAGPGCLFDANLPACTGNDLPGPPAAPANRKINDGTVGMEVWTRRWSTTGMTGTHADGSFGDKWCRN